MRKTPLDPPEDSRVLEQFIGHFRIPYPAHRQSVLRDVVAAFSRLPYENLTKIIQQAEYQNPERSRRSPADVVAQHRKFGTGGTCFSLTAALLHLVRALGFRAEPILADRAYGQDTHSALLVWIDRIPHLLDPGFLILDPVRLDRTEPKEIETSFNRLILQREPENDRIKLYSVQQGERTFRLTFKIQPVSPPEFLRVWDSSFDWDMMRYPLLTRMSQNRQLYLQGNRLQFRSHECVERRLVPFEKLQQLISENFGIHPAIVARALEVLHRKGEWDGKT